MCQAIKDLIEDAEKGVEARMEGKVKEAERRAQEAENRAQEAEQNAMKTKMMLAKYLIGGGGRSIEDAAEETGLSVETIMMLMK